MGKTMATPSTIMKIVKPRDAVEEGMQIAVPDGRTSGGGKVHHIGERPAWLQAQPLISQHAQSAVEAEHNRSREYAAKGCVQPLVDAIAERTDRHRSGRSGGVCGADYSFLLAKVSVAKKQLFLHISQYFSRLASTKCRICELPTTYQISSPC